MRARSWILALLAALFVTLSGPLVHAKTVNAGPIHNNQDAQTKCPMACGRHGWDGEWWSKGFTSYCKCGGPIMTPPHQAVPIGPGTSCSAPPTQACSGCEVSCPAGKEAHCTGGQDTSGSPMCWTQAVCECKG
jgi:hypothetical protein